MGHRARHPGHPGPPREGLPRRAPGCSLRSAGAPPGPLVLDVAGVEGGGRLEKEDVDFFVRHGAVLDASRDDQEISFVEPDVAVPQFHAEAALDHQEKLVLVVVVVPGEGALEFHELHLLAVQLGDDAGVPMIGEGGELLPEIHFFHVLSPQRRRTRPGRAPVALPSRYTCTPLTQTPTIPAEGWCGASGVARSPTVAGSNSTRSA